VLRNVSILPHHDVEDNEMRLQPRETLKSRILDAGTLPPTVLPVVALKRDRFIPASYWFGQDSTPLTLPVLKPELQVQGNELTDPLHACGVPYSVCV